MTKAYGLGILPLMKPFAQASYRSQLHRIRLLAVEALRQYPFRVEALDFIHHGENTTFRITARDGARYLLRVARPDYHTVPAMNEEMKWLKHVNRKGTAQVPMPVTSKHGRVVEKAFSPDVGDRNFCVFKWIDGQFIEKRLSESTMFELGQLLGRLQNASPSSRHRHYWTVDGLVGTQPKFGPVHSLVGISKAKCEIIENARKQIHRKLKAFERRHPNRYKLIHADAHFGNILRTSRGLALIDFDDCGVGFRAYDLAIPLISAGGILGPKRRKELPVFRAALISGFSSEANWDRFDDENLDDLISARRIMMLGWLSSRSDNPRLKKHLKGAVGRVIRHLRSVGLAD